ncbi:MAG: SGNH/GDSL hydrolase family protein [Clostridia bacterium]|nr:SGNH/GDSL hydrolase family protein [Clostridia bacterium]
MQDFQSNIVPALDQNSANVFLYKDKRSKLKILFVGNSITKHEPKPSIGWHRDCGMAASSVEKDYVHLIVRRIMEKYDENVSYGIAQVAQYEWDFFECGPERDYGEARAFDADIILMFFGANVSRDYDTMENPPKTFAKAYEDMRNYLAPSDAAVFHSAGFYIRPVLDAEKRLVAEKYGDKYIDISDISNLAETHGLFNHPSDLGMQMLADMFFEAIEADVRRICEK